MSVYRYCFTSYEYVEVEAENEEEAFEMAEREVENLYNEVELIAVDDEDY